MASVYLMTTNRGKYKIGFTTRPIKNRIKQLQTGNPDKIKLVFEKKVKVEKHAHRLEQYLLRKYKKYALKGERLKLNMKQVNEIIFLMTTLSIEEVFFRYKRYNKEMNYTRPMKYHKEKTKKKFKEAFDEKKKQRDDFLMKVFQKIKEHPKDTVF